MALMKSRVFRQVSSGVLVLEVLN